MGRSICSVCIDGSARARGGPLLLASRALRPSAMAGANVLALRDGGLAFDVVITRLGREDAHHRWLPEALGLTLVTRAFEPEQWNSNPLIVGAIEPGGALDRWNQSQRASGTMALTKIGFEFHRSGSKNRVTSVSPSACGSHWRSASWRPSRVMTTS